MDRNRIAALLEDMEAALLESGHARTPAGAAVLDAVAQARSDDWSASHLLKDDDFGLLLAAMAPESREFSARNLDRLIALHGASYEALVLAADLSLSLDLSETCRTAADAALEIAPHSPQATALRGRALSALGDLSGGIDALRRATLLQPGYGEAHRRLADELRYANMLDGAIDHYRRALSIDPGDDAAEKGLEIALAAAIPPWQTPMLNDGIRNAAFDGAIRRAVKPGMRVLDIGTGTGLLAMMAVRAGAAHVTALERIGVLVETARKIIADNGMAERITVLHKSSMAAEIGEDMPEAADLLVAEIVDAGLLAEGVLSSFTDAKERLLKPGARIIPEGATVIAAPIESDCVTAMFHCDEASGFDLSAYEEIAPRLHLQADLHRIAWQPLARPVEVFTFDFANTPDAPEEADHKIIPLADGTAGAVAFWFALRLDNRNTLSTGPEAPPTHWQQAVAPLRPPVDLCQNQPVRLIARHDAEIVRFEVKA